MMPAFTSQFVKAFLIFGLVAALFSCHRKKQFYKSDCDDDKLFKHISFAHLMDSLPYYNNQYVEVSGKYKQDKGLSALYNDSLFVDHSNNKALWVEFSPDCPLYLTGTRIGFFDYDYNNGKLTPVNNTTITLRGKINSHFKGHLNAYKGAIEHISYIKI